MKLYTQALDPLRPVVLVALDKVVAAGTSVSNHDGELAISVEDNAVGAGAATSEEAARGEDGEFLPGAGNGDVEALAVVKGVGVVVPADLLAVLVVVEALVESGGDVVVGVAVVAAGGGAGLAALGGAGEDGHSG